MKPTFSLRVRGRTMQRNPSTKAEAVVVRKSTNEKNQQLQEAIHWCEENNARGQAALKSGLFPLIKDRETINRRLDGKIIHNQERAYCKILTHDEEESIVAFIKNKNRCMQAVNKKDLEKLIMDVLRIRSFTNKKMGGGRKYLKLSNNAKSALEKGKYVVFFKNSFQQLLKLKNFENRSFWLQLKTFLMQLQCY